MDSNLGAVLLVGAVVAAGVGLLMWLVERGRKNDRPAPRPSLAVRLVALALGLVAALLLFLGYGRDMYVSIAMFLLLGYGVSGLVARRRPAGQEQPPARVKRSTIWAAAAIAVVVVALAAYLVITLQQHQPLTIAAVYPQTVVLGEQFDIVLTLASRSDQPVAVRSLDLSPALDSNNEWILSGARLT